LIKHKFYFFDTVKRPELTPYDYLKNFQEDIPAWLDNYNQDTPFNYEDFFNSRVVYYPGSGTDGHAVKLFGKSHSAHCFVYIDYFVDQSDIERQLSNEGFRGYETIVRLQLSERDLVPDGWAPGATFHNDSISRGGLVSRRGLVAPFGFLEILQRKSNYGQDHGARRLAIVFLGADAIASYDALFCQTNSPAPPFALLLQDHGFGGNYDRFGRGGLLSKIAERAKCFPEFLVVAEWTDPWDNYSQIEGLTPDKGGMHDSKRYLYRRDPEPIIQKTQFQLDID
jgi:hypothetical protein